MVRAVGRYHADAFQRSIISEAIYHFTTKGIKYCNNNVLIIIND